MPSLQLTVFNHISHVGWGAKHLGTRTYMAAALATVVAPLRALLGQPPLEAAVLVGLTGVDRVKGKERGWWKSGAYCESEMRTTRLYQFVALYGEEEGTRQHAEWYHACKVRAGEL